MHEFPKLETLRLKGWLDAFTRVYPDILAQDEIKKRLRKDPRHPIKTKPLQGAKKREDLLRHLSDILDDLRKYNFEYVADEVATTKKLAKQAIILNNFCQKQVALYGDPKDRPTRKIDPFLGRSRPSNNGDHPDRG